MTARAYYNEIDPNAAAWLRELIREGLIADGDVDTRSIADVRAEDVRGYTQCHWFAGIGGWSYALRLAGWSDARPVWTGSCPCQPFSSAGAQAGGNDPRDLWPAWFHLLRECRPRVVFGEQVEGAIGHGWLDRLCDDVEAEGYAVGPVCLPAAGVGAPHIRQRLYFVLADTDARRRRTYWEHRIRAAKIGGRPLDDDDRAKAADAGAFGELAESGSERRAGLRLRVLAGGSLAAGAEVGRGGEAGELGDANQRVGGQRGPLDRGRDSRSDAEPRPGSGGASALGFWSACDWIPCRDGKYRPAQPGILPLVARLPGELVPSGDPSEPYAQATIEARVMRLRGYGNAIVPQLAAEVIGAFMDMEID